MEKTQMAYVISNSGTLKEERLKYYGNISREQNYFSEKDIEDAFREKRSSLKIAFVCQKWLTGFDVKCLSFLFLDRPLRNHALMQAIARPNRVDVGKDKGLVIDYIKNSKNIILALKDYSNSDIGIKSIEELREEVISCFEWIENLFLNRNIPLKELLDEKDIYKKRKILTEIVGKLNCFANNEKSLFKKQFLNLNKYFSFLDTNQCQEFREKFDAIKEINKQLFLLMGENNCRKEMLPEFQGVINEYVEAEDVRKHHSVENIFDLPKIFEDEKKDEKSRLIEKIIEDKKLAYEDIKENFERKMNLEKKENFQRRIDILVENWNNLVDLEIQDLKELYKNLKVERKNIKEDNESHLKNGLTISGNAIFEKIKNCDESKEIEEEKLKNGCVYLDCKMMEKFKKFKSLKESFNLFDENESTNSGIRKDIWLSLLTSTELELKRENFEFVYNYYKKLFLKRPVWFDQ